MKPDGVVQELAEYGLKTTRRTVLTYEKEGLIPKPFIETGKSKEYPRTVVAEFIASWCLIHGEYGLKITKAADVRKTALKILYGFDSIWDKEIPNSGVDNLQALVRKRTNWRKPMDFFVFAWIMARTAILDGVPSCLFFPEFIEKGDLSVIPDFDINVNYVISKKRINQSKLHVTSTRLLMPFGERRRGCVRIDLCDEDGEFISPSTVADFMDVGGGNMQAGYQDAIFLLYLHPEDYSIIRPL